MLKELHPPMYSTRNAVLVALAAVMGLESAQVLCFCCCLTRA